MKEAVLVVVAHLALVLAGAAVAATVDDLWHLMTWRYVIDQLPGWVLV